MGSPVVGSLSAKSPTFSCYVDNRLKPVGVFCVKYYIDDPNLWAPQEYTGVLAVLLPNQLRVVPSEAIYLKLLKKRLEWLIRQKQHATPTTQQEAHELLQQAISVLNPCSSSQPGPPNTKNKSHCAWREAWAQTIIEESGTIQNLLATTRTRFPQPIALIGRKSTLMRFFVGPTAYRLEEWLADLVYAQTRLANRRPVRRL